LRLKVQLQIFETLSSTQDEMRSRLESGETIHGLVIRALEQTSGRGQRARNWLSSRGGSYQTLAIKDPEATLHKSYAAIAVAIGITKVLREQSIQAGVKWPNDIYLENKKLAGILCEYLKEHLFIGVGVNVHNEIPDYATRLQKFEIETVSDMVIDGIKLGLELLQTSTDLPILFKPYDVLEGKSISVKVGNTIKEGIARGVDQHGCLRLEQTQGIFSICSGHIGNLV
jgi:BirA family biotin operon repressor/biotin-[acetyl-CoA-carboxylase] ligase